MISSSQINITDDDRTETKTESLDFSEIESVSWRKHQHRQFFQDKGMWLHLTSHRTKDIKLWILIITTGFLVACAGTLVIVLTDSLFHWKFDAINKYIADNQWGLAFVTYLFMNHGFAFIAGLLCVLLPPTAGSGIPEIKAFLNGVKLDNALTVPVLFAKIIGMCFSVASSLPLGKEGPMIHVGSIIGAVISQGWRGLDMPLASFQDMRNDYTKRDFITIGAAAGVAAAFKAPIGGILFTLEEGASFWSLTLTISAFICAAITQLTISLMFANYTGDNQGTFAFGQFDTLVDGRSNYYTYELIMFILIGAAGGCWGALFNHIHTRVMTFRMKYVKQAWKRMLELMALVFVFTIVSFVFPLMYKVCTPLPSSTNTAQEKYLLGKLVQFQCASGEYNDLASLFFTPSEIGMQQLYHMREVDGTGHDSIGIGALILFFFPYFFLAAYTPGILAPAGLFIPTLFSGAAFGRFIGHIMNYISPGRVADAGSYALIGSAAVLGGMSHMTISGTVILLEACGNTSYLLPLMLTFSVARYVGSKFNSSLYDTQLKLLNYPFLEGEIDSIGLINYDVVAKVMAHPVVSLRDVDSVRNIYNALSITAHNGFPVVRNGRLCGLILRKTLCQLLKLKAFSSYAPSAVGTPSSELNLQSEATIFYDTLEKGYPDYPKISDISIIDAEKDKFVDLRPYMDTAPYVVDTTCSVQRCYKLFRTMGLRHIIVIDGDHAVLGIVTRKDITEEKLRTLEERDNQSGDETGSSSSPLPTVDVESDHNAVNDDQFSDNRPRRSVPLASAAY